MKAPIFGRPGLSVEDFNRLLDGYLTTGTLVADEYAKLNKDQENVIQEVKKSITRIHYKLNKKPK